MKNCVDCKERDDRVTKNRKTAKNIYSALMIIASWVIGVLAVLAGIMGMAFLVQQGISYRSSLVFGLAAFFTGMYYVSSQTREFSGGGK